MGSERRCSTGLPGLDAITGGGLPMNRLYLVQGPPGVGKTTLALQFLQEGAARGEKGLYITLSETKEELESIAISHDWRLDNIAFFELSAVEERLKDSTSSTFFHPSEIELDLTTKALLEEVEKIQPARVVFDSLSEMRMLAETPLRYRRQILQFKQFFAGRKCTVLMLDDCTSGEKDLQIESIAHGVIGITCSSPGYGISRRQINIQKIRGVKFHEGNHDLVLQKGGMVIFPRLVAADHPATFTNDRFESGISELDALLGGGLDRGTSNMFMGPPGTGKSTVAIKFALQAARRNEKVLAFVFDETLHTLTSRAAALGMDIGPHVESGLITLEPINPAEISPGELANRIRYAVLREGVRMVIIDSINGYLNAMPEERYLSLQLHELLSFLNQQGVITIMVLAQQGLVGAMQSTVDLTYLADTVLLMRYYEVKGAVRQALSVIKKRSGNHERTIREVKIDRNGIEVGEALTHFHGVLTGLPRFVDPEEDAGKPTPGSMRLSTGPDKH
ncbi:MAG TPA: ATPase domain-containing protein [Candidatus Methylacidiphilales bacterium]|jgi:circadian clock protein KaiC|nr:ATPase domain-containing protein [Candidatus Methylacidiphilales bacterium]